MEASGGPFRTTACTKVVLAKSSGGLGSKRLSGHRLRPRGKGFRRCHGGAHGSRPCQPGWAGSAQGHRCTVHGRGPAIAIETPVQAGHSSRDGVAGLMVAGSELMAEGPRPMAGGSAMTMGASMEAGHAGQDGPAMPAQEQPTMAPASSAAQRNASRAMLAPRTDSICR